MQTKSIEKEKAIKLRKEGQSYSEILKVVPVAKSTLSDWLRDVGLSKKQKQNLTQKKLDSIKRGALARKNQRIDKTNIIIKKTEKEIGSLSKREMFLIGIALYWAEGTKQKVNNVSQPVAFGNSDPNMVKCFLYWLSALGVTSNDIMYELYIHKNGNVDKAIIFWSNTIKQPVSVFKNKIYFKKGNPKTKRKNIGDGYNGLIRIRVKRSTDLNRKIKGWIQGIVSCM